MSKIYSCINLPSEFSLGISENNTLSTKNLPQENTAEIHNSSFHSEETKLITKESAKEKFEKLRATVKKLSFQNIDDIRLYSAENSVPLKIGQSMRDRIKEAGLEEYSDLFNEKFSQKFILGDSIGDVFYIYRN